MKYLSTAPQYFILTKMLKCHLQIRNVLKFALKQQRLYAAVRALGFGCCTAKMAWIYLISKCIYSLCEILRCLIWIVSQGGFRGACKLEICWLPKGWLHTGQLEPERSTWTTIASPFCLGTWKSLGLSHSHGCWGSHLLCLRIFHYPDIITVHLTGPDISLPALSV